MMGDLHGVAAVLWASSCREGVAWRRLERRARRALELGVLSAAGFRRAAISTGVEALAAK
jgi:hypothetical protein